MADLRRTLEKALEVVQKAGDFGSLAYLAGLEVEIEDAIARLDNQPAQTSEPEIIRDWLRGNAISCPRCGGCVQGYSTWIIVTGFVVCDNCHYPRPSEDSEADKERHFVETGELF